MKIKQNFKDIKKPEDIKAEALDSYLSNLYKNASITKSKTNILIDELISLTGNNKFEVLRSKLSQFVYPGESKKIVEDLMKTSEAICYKLSNNLVATPEKFKAEVKGATINACDAGALTNMQKMLYSMDDSLYTQKYDYIQNLANEYIRDHKLAKISGMEVHLANELIHEVSKAYNIVPSRDVYARYRNLSQRPNEDFQKNAKFKDYLDQHLNTREGIYSFAENVANSYLSNLPNAPENNQKFMAKTNGIDNEHLEQITAVADSLNIPVTSIINYSEDGKKFEYNTDYMSIIKAAVMQDLIKQEMIEHDSLIVNERENVTTYAPPRREKDESGKTVIIYDRTGTSKSIETKNQIIQSSDGWYLTENIADKVVPSKKILDTSRLKELTINGENIEDYLHAHLKEDLENGISFEDSLRVVIENNKNRVQLQNLDISKELFFLSDQVQALQIFLTTEEIASLSLGDRNNWSRFSKLVVDDSPEALSYVAGHGDKELLSKYLKYSNKTNQDLINWRGNDNNTLLHIAAKNGNYTIIPALVESGINIEEKDQANGAIALHWAAANGKVEVVAKLIELGADIKSIDKSGNTALRWAATNGKVEVVAKLIELGADINAKNKNGNTALHWASSKGNVEVVAKLIELGANLNVRKTFMGNTFLNQIIKDGSLHKSFIEGVKNSKKAASIIIDLVKEGGGWFYDNDNAWKLIEKVIKNPNFNKDKVKIIAQVLNETKNESRRNNTISHN